VGHVNCPAELTPEQVEFATAMNEKREQYGRLKSAALAALRDWREAEKDLADKANHITFNVHAKALAKLRIAADALPPVGGGGGKGE
jgi:hypothetical protein